MNVGGLSFPTPAHFPIDSVSVLIKAELARRCWWNRNIETNSLPWRGLESLTCQLTDQLTNHYTIVAVIMNVTLHEYKHHIGPTW